MKIKKLCLCITLLNLSTISPVFSAGFQLNPTSGAVSRSLAGSGVTDSGMEDIYYNPAALSSRDKFQCQSSFLYLNIKNKFEADSSNSSSNNTSDDNGYPFSLICGGKLKNSVHAGISIAPTFGLSSTYADNWTGRYHAINSELIVIDINPMIAIQIPNSDWGIGAGVSFQYADVTLGQAIFLGPGNPDGFTELTGDSTGFGYNIGAIYSNDSIKLGLSARSKIEHDIEGSRQISGTGILDGKVGAYAKLTLPESVTFSINKKLTSKVNLLASARWTRWSRFSEIRASFDDGSPDSVTPQNWNDSWTYGIALERKFKPDLKGIISVGYDQTPVPGRRFRDPRVPDTDRTIFGLGLEYMPENSRCAIGFSYHQTRAGSRSIDRSIRLTGGITDNLTGEFKQNNIHVFGLSFSYSFNSKKKNCFKQLGIF